LAELTLGEREKVLSERYLCERDNLISVYFYLFFEKYFCNLEIYGMD